MSAVFESLYSVLPIIFTFISQIRGVMSALFGPLCSQLSVYVCLPSWGNVVRPFRISVLSILYMCLPAWIVLSALFGSLCFQIWVLILAPFGSLCSQVFICMRLAPRVIVMSALVGSLISQLFTCSSQVGVVMPKFKKSMGSTSNIDLLFGSNCLGSTLVFFKGELLVRGARKWRVMF